MKFLVSWGIASCNLWSYQHIWHSSFSHNTHCLTDTSHCLSLLFTMGKSLSTTLHSTFGFITSSLHHSVIFMNISAGFSPVVAWSVYLYISRKFDNFFSGNTPWPWTCVLRFVQPSNLYMAAWNRAKQMCLIQFSCMDIAMSSNVNWGLLFNTSCIGIPWLANISCVSFIMCMAIVLFMINALGHFEWVYTMMKNRSPWNGPAKST